MMIYGNHIPYSQLLMLLTKLLTDPGQELYPFILLVGPAHIGKSSMIQDIIAESDLNPYDVVTLRDLSDDRAVLKESNELAGTFHPIQIEVESKRQDIKLDDGSIVHNRGVRELQEWLVRSPLGSDKVVIIEGIHRATGGAANALLKTLEEPLPHRLMIATADQIEQLPSTIVSRAMIFHMDRLSDAQMAEWIMGYLPDVSSTTHQSLLQLAAGRPGLIVSYNQKSKLDEIIQGWESVQTYMQTGPIATLYQQMITINKSGYLSVIIDALLYSDNRIVYDTTYDLMRKMGSNVGVDNLLFEWCGQIKNQ